MNDKAYSISVKELSELGKDNIPEEFIPGCHLIYSSPATLVYNSPGAIGFGVKRAGLVLPESVMLLLGPACCGRNSTILGAEEGYADRMFYLQMDETDLVTGRHLSAIPEAVKEIMKAKPDAKAVLVCTTCVDALLATDLEALCMDATEKCGIRVIPSYMYALTREGRKPPMTLIRQTIYSLVERLERKSTSVNIMGFFSGMDPENDLFALLRSVGIKDIYEIGNMTSLDKYYRIGECNFNIVLDPESNFAAEDMKKRLGMPYIELARLYDADRIHKQYQLFASAIGVTFDDEKYYKEAKEASVEFSRRHKGQTVAVGEMTNGNPFEISCAFAGMGLVPKAVFSNVTANDFPYINRLAAASPDTRVYTGISPSMVHFDEPLRTDIAVGKDACMYCKADAAVEWYSEKQPFGFKAVTDLLRSIDEVSE